MILNLPTLESRSPTGWYGFDRKLAFWSGRQSVSRQVKSKKFLDRWRPAVDKTIRRAAPDWTDGQKDIRHWCHWSRGQRPLCRWCRPWCLRVSGLDIDVELVREQFGTRREDRDAGKGWETGIGIGNAKTQAGSRCRWNISSRRPVPSAPPSVSDSVRVFFRGTCNRSNRPRSGTHKEDLEPRRNLMALWRRVLIGRPGWEWPPAELQNVTGDPEVFTRRHSPQAQRSSAKPHWTRWHGWNALHYSAAASQGCESTCHRTLFTVRSLAVLLDSTPLFAVLPVTGPPNARLVCSLAGECGAAFLGRGNPILSSRVLPCRAPDRERTRERRNAKCQCHHGLFVMTCPVAPSMETAGIRPARLRRPPRVLPEPMDPRGPGRPRRRTVIKIGTEHSGRDTVQAV